MLRFASVTDIHYGFDSGNKKGSSAPRLVDRFIKAANDNKVDFAVDLGDRIIFRNPEQDRYYLRQLSAQFNTLAVPRKSLQGNHDEWNLSREENAEILGGPIHSRSEDINGYHVVFWSPTVIGHKYLDVSDEDMQWLRDDLATTDKPVILLNHIPLDNRGQPDRDETSRPHFSFYVRGHQVREILEAHGNVKLCISGHRHRNQISQINGITYITQQSLTQKIPGRNRAYGAFAIYEIEGDTLQIKASGKNQKSRTIHLG